MNKREYLRLQAVLYLVVAVFAVSIPLWNDVADEGLGWPFALLMAAVFGFFAFRSYQKSKTTAETEMPYAPPTDATPSDQVRYYTRILRIGMGAFTMLSIITAYDVYYLETEPNATAMLLAPVGFVYEQFGAVPAALCIPTLGVVCAAILRKRINQLKSEM